MGKRKRTKSALQDDLPKKKQKFGETSKRFGWAKFPGHPWWPVEVLEETERHMVVYICSDNARMTVTFKNFTTANEANEKKTEGIAYLKKKNRIKELQAFKADLKWAHAQDTENSCEVDKDYHNSQDTENRCDVDKDYHKNSCDVDKDYHKNSCDVDKDYHKNSCDVDKDYHNSPDTENSCDVDKDYHKNSCDVDKDYHKNSCDIDKDYHNSPDTENRCDVDKDYHKNSCDVDKDYHKNSCDVDKDYHKNSCDVDKDYHNSQDTENRCDVDKDYHKNSCDVDKDYHKNSCDVDKDYHKNSCDVDKDYHNSPDTENSCDVDKDYHKNSCDVDKDYHKNSCDIDKDYHNSPDTENRCDVDKDYHKNSCDVDKDYHKNSCDVDKDYHKNSCDVDKDYHNSQDTENRCDVDKDYHKNSCDVDKDYHKNSCDVDKDYHKNSCDVDKDYHNSPDTSNSWEPDKDYHNSPDTSNSWEPDKDYHNCYTDLSDDEQERIPFEQFVDKITEERREKEELEKQSATSKNGTTNDDENSKPCQRNICENDKIRDLDCMGIYVKKYCTSTEGKKGLKKDHRPYDTVHACKFCFQLFTHIQDHLEKRHKNETDVMKIIELKDKTVKDENQKKMLKQLQSLIRQEGDHLHNRKVIKHRRGELLVQRKACGRETFDFKKYGPCHKCLSWMHIENSLQTHKKRCQGNDSSIVVFGQEKKRVNVALSKAIIGENLDIEKTCPLVKKHVIPIMRNDEIGQVAKDDRLINELGEIWMVKSYGNKLVRNKTSSFRMRLCARLLTTIRGLRKQANLTVKDILSPEHFDDIVKATINLCEEDTDGNLKHPSVALKVGYDLGRLAGLKLCSCIKEKDLEGEAATKHFLKVLRFQWSTKVSKLAHLTVSEKHFDNHRELPHPKDIATIAERLVELAKELKLSEAGQYHEVVQVALPRLMVYNRRRSGEIEALPIERYQKRTISVDDVEECLLGDLTSLEKYLLETQELMWIRGKQGKRVPVLIPADMKEPLAYIANKNRRREAGIKEGNPYLFANKGHGVYNALQCLRASCSDDELIHPDRLTSTGYRAYMATIAQCIGLKDHEVQYMCDHLGHTIDVHRAHYRHTMGGIERIELGKLIMIQDRNMIKEYRSKGLEGIQFTDIIETYEQQHGPNQNIQDPFNFNEEVVDVEDKVNSTTKSRQKWTLEEEGELKRLFRTNFDTLKCPNTKEIITAKKISEKENGFVYLRKLETIKKKMSNMIIKIKMKKQ